MEKPLATRIWEWFTVRDREENLRDATPPKVREASHGLANEVAKAQQCFREVSRRADALATLVRRAHKEEREEYGPRTDHK